MTKQTLLLEFDDDMQTRKIVSEIVKSEIKEKRMSKTRFAELHKSYLDGIKKPESRGTYQGNYLLVCYDGCIDDHDGQYLHFEKIVGNLQIDSVFDLHADHNFILFSFDVVKKSSIRKFKQVKELLRK